MSGLRANIQGEFEQRHLGMLLDYVTAIAWHGQTHPQNQALQYLPFLVLKA
ncbi:hypothetical protein [Fischerella sp. NIES-3754]|uniref:hypothetical protein n=1 Tax=Fischerella sp. NIES-3754 TaxID=1752063 RepID=UPI000B1C0103|nr:hypothetical protein [Fischerella sp. NIES-3754]